MLLVGVELGERVEIKFYPLHTVGATVDIASGEKAPTLPVFADYRFENVVIKGIYHCRGPYFINIKGFDEGDYAVNNVKLKNIHCLNVDKETALHISKCKNLVMENVTFDK